MDATRPQQPPLPPPPPEGGPDVVHPSPDHAVQQMLPLDLDAPIPFALTARARRFVAPDGLPDLAVVTRAPGPAAAPSAPRRQPVGAPHQRRLVDAVPVDLDDPHDTRPPRARALRRAGLDTAGIAAELEVDELEVRAWIDGVTPVRSATRRLRAVDSEARAEAAHTAARQRFAQAQASGREEAAARLDDPALSTGLALLSGIAEIGPHAVVCTVREPTVGAAALRWLRGAIELDPSRLRVLLRLAPQVAADQAAHRWAEALDVAPDRIAYTRWRGAPDADAVEATVRIADPVLAGRLAGWREVLLRTMADPGAVSAGGGDGAW